MRHLERRDTLRAMHMMRSFVLPATWLQSERLLTHAREALDALPADSAFLPAATLARQCAVYLHRRGAIAAAEDLYTRALTIYERVLGPRDAEVARTLYYLGLVKWSQGRYHLAEASLRRSLAIRETAFGPDHINIAPSIVGLALVHRDQGRYQEGVCTVPASLDYSNERVRNESSRRRDDPQQSCKRIP